MTSSDLTFVRTDIGLALLGGVVAAAGAGLVPFADAGWVVLACGAMFAAVAVFHLAVGLAFPAGWKSGPTGVVLMVALPVALIGPFAVFALARALDR